jgi:hydroxyacylglutathione hydrolase
MDGACVESADVVQVGTPFYGVFVLRGERAVLVDTGPQRSGRGVLRRLAAAGIAPEELSLIVLTHAHADHVGGAAALQRATGALVVAGLGDEPILAAGANPPLTPTGPAGRAFLPFAGSKFAPLAADLVVSERMDLRPFGVEAEVRRVGGHTEGSLVVVLTSGDVVAGDLLRSALPGPKDKPRLHFFHDDVVAAHGAVAALVAEGAGCLYIAHGGPLDAARVGAWLADGAR